MYQKLLRATLLCLCLQLPLAAAKDVYVSPGGDDANPGTEQAPVATLKKAIEAMRDAGPGTIWLGPGEYFMPEGVALNARVGGTAQQPLVIRSTQPHQAKLSGARRVKDFRPITAEEAKPLISEEAKKNVLVAELEPQGFAPLREMPLQHRAHKAEEVLFGDRPMQSARWPNDGFAVFDEVVDSGASKVTHWVQREVYRPGSFRFPGDRAKHWDFDRGVWLHGFWCYGWADEALRAATFNAETGELRLAAKHAYGIGSPWRKDSKHQFYALHVFEELDQPGEYYLDRKKQKLFFWPPGDVNQTSVRLTLCTNPILRAYDVEHLVIRDLVVEGGCDTGIALTKCRHCRVVNCLVRNMGYSGINLSGTDLAAERCEVTQTASYAISVYGGDRKTLTPGECSVVGCHLHHVGRLDWMGGRGIRLSGCGNRLANNLIHHGPTGAVSYGGNEHVLELNEAHHVCLHYSDVGVFYTGRDWASRGNVVRWNYIHHITNNEGHGSSGIYLDDCDSGDTVVGNIVFRGVGRGVLLGGGRDNRLLGNIFIDLPVGIHVDARGPHGITLDKPGSWNLLAKCEQLDYLSPLWRERYPRLACVMDEDPLQPRGNVMHSNILLNCEKPFALARGVEAEWLDRKDNVEWKLEDYPNLVTEANGHEQLNFAELPKLWEKVPGFEPIPLERIGLEGLD